MRAGRNKNPNTNISYLTNRREDGILTYQKILKRSIR